MCMLTRTIADRRTRSENGAEEKADKEEKEKEKKAKKKQDSLVVQSAIP